MNTLSRIVICLIVMMVPVTVKAGFDKIDEPLPAIGPEGADTLTQGWEFVNTFDYAVQVFWSNSKPPFSVDKGGDPTDIPTISAPTITPGIQSNGTDWYSLVQSGGHYKLTFQVIPPQLDNDAEVPPDFGWAKVDFNLWLRRDGTAPWIAWGSQGTAKYIYGDPGTLPEPATLVLLGVGAIGLRARRKQAA
jgi:hypothetical protein